MDKKSNNDLYYKIIKLCINTDLFDTIPILMKCTGSAIVTSALRIPEYKRKEFMCHMEKGFELFISDIKKHINQYEEETSSLNKRTNHD